MLILGLIVLYLSNLENKCNKLGLRILIISYQNNKFRNLIMILLCQVAWIQYKINNRS